MLSTIVNREDWGLDLGGTVTTNSSEVLDLGGAPEFSLGGRAFVVEGEPVPVVRGLCVTNPNEFADPDIESDCVYGPNVPTLILGVTTAVRLPYGLMLSARGEYQGGHYAYNVNDGESFTRGIRWPNCFNALPAIDAGDLSQVNAIERARCISSFANRDFAIYPQDFFKLREVTFSAPVPFEVPGATDATLILSARNTFRWFKAKYNFADPESTGNFGFGDTGMSGAVQTTGEGFRLRHSTPFQSGSISDPFRKGNGFWTWIRKGESNERYSEDREGHGHGLSTSSAPE